MKTLNDVHLQQIQSYLDFEKQNRKKILLEVEEEIRDHINSRIEKRDTYQGDELVEKLQDLPDIIDTSMDNLFEHQRDMTMVLIQNAFIQFKAKNKEISLNVPTLEDEATLKEVNMFVEKMVAEPEVVINEAPKAEPGSKIKQPSPKLQRTTEKRVDPRIENNELKKQIADQLAVFPQYKKLLEMIREREIQIKGLKARL